ncbi:MAG: hypothetical protein EA341_00175 [Mongoliibacter sp.]|uniref:hypothetical protein n=1 Tax=Mongoliibacter sp. TaxID=2022438 RepID=UPI0012F3C135|nr:hypothetical protein [Mongoliibacter sp.]TVP54458.1 MAG: hypothetical protein EA341_00175 [Mongoliibacter sp.]
MKTTTPHKSENFRLDIPGIEQVRSYFQKMDCPVEEAEVFYYYYQSLDWRNENGTILRDWRSVAINWMWNLED